jgi:hypothetical protein
MRPIASVFIALLCAFTVACESKPQTTAEVAKDAPVTAKNAPEVVTQQSSLVAADSSTVGEFDKRLKDYMSLQKQLSGSLKRLPDRASPQEIDTNQRALGALIQKARADAHQGDIFIPGMQTYIRGVVRRVLSGPDGAKIKASLMDENPMKVKIEVNGRYPDTIPMSTMPPDILSALPPLPEDVEYRFVGNRLVLLDTKSHVIVDFVENTFDL